MSIENPGKSSSVSSTDLADNMDTIVPVSSASTEEEVTTKLSTASDASNSSTKVTSSKAANLDATISDSSTSTSTTEEKVTTKLSTENHDTTHYGVPPSTAPKGTDILK